MFCVYDNQEPCIEYFDTLEEAEEYANQLISDYLNDGSYYEDYVQLGYMVEPTLRMDKKEEMSGVVWNFDYPQSQEKINVRIRKFKVWR